MEALALGRVDALAAASIPSAEAASAMAERYGTRAVPATGRFRPPEE